jgi:AcrR family transcriptional regulator
MKRASDHLTERGQEKRKRLVDAAYETIAEKGLEGLRTRPVAALAGVNIATLHYYFPTKEDLIKGVTERLLKEFSSIVDPQIKPSGVRPALRKEFADQLFMARTHSSTFLVLMEIYIRSFRDHRLRSIVQSMVSFWESHITSYLKPGVENGEFSSVRSVQQATRLLQCALTGSVINLLLFGTDYPMTAIARELDSWMSGSEAQK